MAKHNHHRTDDTHIARHLVHLSACHRQLAEHSVYGIIDDSHWYGGGRRHSGVGEYHQAYRARRKSTRGCNLRHQRGVDFGYRNHPCDSGGVRASDDAHRHGRHHVQRTGMDCHHCGVRLDHNRHHAYPYASQQDAKREEILRKQRRRRCIQGKTGQKEAHLRQNIWTNVSLD